MLVPHSFYKYLVGVLGMVIVIFIVPNTIFLKLSLVLGIIYSVSFYKLLCSTIKRCFISVDPFWLSTYV